MSDNIDSTRPDFTGPDFTGPDFTGPDFTGPDFTGPDFTGKIALITGASRGLGRIIALGIAERGGTVAGTARQLHSSPGVGGTLAETFELVEKAGAKGLAIPGDITTSEGMASAVQQTMHAFGRIDILVNNAGIFPFARIDETSPQDWHDLMTINVAAPFLAAYYVVPVMQRQGGGNILNVSSGAARNLREGRIGYISSKWAMNRLTLNLAEELRADGIAVNGYNPGMVRTDMNLDREGAEDPMLIEPSAMWLAAQDVSFTGQIVSRAEFGQTWGAA